MKPATCLIGLISTFACVFSSFGAADEPPPLPPGLAPTAPAPSTEDGGAPPLPPGLSNEPPSSSGEPSLPEGLTGNAPPLPQGLGEETAAPTQPEEPKHATLADQLPPWLHGFWEGRAGARLREDPAQPADMSIAETRLQLKAEKDWQNVILEFTGDAYLDGIREKGDYDLRRLRLTWTPISPIDIRAGRQVLTWGTGDMLFINDLFPKDWQSFFIGRDDEYLKAPSDTIKVGWFNDFLNMEVAYTPQFTPDRYINGEYISYYNPLTGRSAGKHSVVDADPPSTWFEDDEWAVRLYRNIHGYELAFYGYSGYWKSPGGQRIVPLQATFPKLRVYGASLRGTLGKGIGNIEFGYYDSYQDRQGNRPLVNNSEFRLLLGYEQDLAKNFTASVQYYLEHMMDYDAYRDTLPFLFHPKDENRHVVTLRLTRLLLHQNLTLLLFGYYSPSDDDAYLRPKINYKVNDNWTVELGGNVFLGREDYTFFGQFQDNTNAYASARYSF